MNEWDSRERRRERRQNQQERIGKYLFAGGITVLVLYIAALILES